MKVSDVDVVVGTSEDSDVVLSHTPAYTVKAKSNESGEEHAKDETLMIIHIMIKSMTSPTLPFQMALSLLC